MLRNIKSLSIILVCLLVFASCRKTIKVDLNAADPKYVIEANVDDRQAVQTVKISKTVNFDQSNNYPAVSGAFVTITDVTSGVIDTLTETIAGTYTCALTGVPHHTYQLYVKADGHVFTAASAMPEHINLDSLYMKSNGILGDYPVASFTDPAATGNAYYFAEYRNGVQTAGIHYRNDELRNDQLIEQPIISFNEEEVDNNYTLRIDMQCIDAPMYNYFFSLEQTQNQNAATPANPISNITGGALGYFSAHTSSVKEMYVP